MISCEHGQRTNIILVGNVAIVRPPSLAEGPPKNLATLLSALARAQQLATSWISQPPQQPSGRAASDILAELNPIDRISFDDQVCSMKALHTLATGSQPRHALCLPLMQI